MPRRKIAPDSAPKADALASVRRGSDKDPVPATKKPAKKAAPLKAAKRGANSAAPARKRIPLPIPAGTARRIAAAEAKIRALTAEFSQEERMAQRVMRLEQAPLHYTNAVVAAQKIQDLYQGIRVIYDDIKASTADARVKSLADKAYEQELNWYGLKRNTLIMLAESKARLTDPRQPQG